MKLRIETNSIKQKILIVSKQPRPFVAILKHQLNNLGADIFLSPAIPKTLSDYDCCFIVDETNCDRLGRLIFKQAVFIFTDKEKTAEKLARHKIKKAKIVSVFGDSLRADQVDKILWFSFSRTKEKLLKLYGQREKKENFLKSIKPSYDLKKTLTFKKIVFSVISLLIMAHGFFLLPLATAGYFNYLTYQALKQEKFQSAADYLKNQRIFLSLAKKSFSAAQPTFLFLSIAATPGNLVDINERLAAVFDKALINQKGMKELLTLILEKNKNPDQKKMLSFRLSSMEKDLRETEENLTSIINKLPSFLPRSETLKKNLVTALEAIGQAKKIIPYFDDLLAKDTEKKYLLLFANNRELRPGGGFIGSFGVLTAKNYSLEDIKIYDVYDADGQLLAHVEPPAAIKKYLKQPHWFLRDSAFSPDFLENFAQAKSFLEKEMAITGFSGSLLITTTAVENILDAFGDIYLPDYKEIVNGKNFYLKTQYYAEKNFFPGSIQKKSFLSAVMSQTLINLESASAKKLLINVKKSFDEKQLVAYFENPGLERFFESLFWSGRIIKPKCVRSLDNCVVDFLMPVDANLGVNKANFFVNRLIAIKTYLNRQGEISHLLSVVFRNESPSEVFPGGRYKNYFQVYLPAATTIGNITANGVAIDDELITNQISDSFRIIGIFIEIPAKSVTEIKIEYRLDETFSRGKGVYQMIVQKQIGSANNDLISEIYLSKNYHLINQNFIPLVKDNQIIYNTNLSADKIFFTELIRE